VSRAGELVGSATRPIQTTMLSAGGAERDPEEWWAAAIAAAKLVLASAGMAATRVVAVACTTQWGVTVPVDAERNALTRAISWMGCARRPAQSRRGRRLAERQGLSGGWVESHRCERTR